MRNVMFYLLITLTCVNGAARKLRDDQPSREIPIQKTIEASIDENILLKETTTPHELDRLLYRFRGRLADMLHHHRGSLATLHHWEHCARIDLDWSHHPAWITLGSSKGTGNRTALRIANRTRVCIHVHPEDSVPWPSWNDRRAARRAHDAMVLRCTQQELPEPAPLWVVTIHASGQIWAWRDGMDDPYQVGWFADRFGDTGNRQLTLLSHPGTTIP